MIRYGSFFFGLCLSLQLWGQNKTMISTLEVFHLESGKRDTVLKEQNHFEAPNWSSDGKHLIINQDGSLYQVFLNSKKKIKLPTGNLNNCNNDHGISFDGKLLAVSNNDPIKTEAPPTSRIYLLPSSGGENPKLITTNFPSYWHGWSPDGKSVVYTAERNGDYNIFRVSVDGGREEQLTFSTGLDDGPEYSPDGNYIYYNSIKSGTMELWRMDNDGANKVQLTNDNYSNWFPHPSPKNGVLVYLAYLQNQGERHPAMKQVALKLYHIASRKIETLCTFTGGQGSINVPSWSPDGTRFAFVSYTYE